MNDIEIKRLAHAVNELRPTWPISSLTTFIGRNLSNKPYRDVALALVWVALDMDNAGNYVSDTPKRVLGLGPWWKASEHTGGLDGHRAQPPKKHEACPRCGGFRGNCACQHENRADDEPDQGGRMSKDEALRMAREALR